MFSKASLFVSLLLIPVIGHAQAPAAIRPRFQGNLNQYLKQHQYYPEKAIDNNAEGDCLVQFVVDEKGCVERIHHVKSSGDAILDQEAERLVASMPSWKPGTYNNVPGRFVCLMPISFRLQ